MIKEKFIKFTDLTEDQVQFIVTHLYIIPSLIRITYEILPGIMTANEKGMEEIIPYDRRQDVKEYLDENAEDAIDATGKLPAMEWNRRMVVNVLGRLPENTEKSQWDSRDIQSMRPIGMDVWSCRIEDIFLTCIAPLAVLLPETWELYGMEVRDDDARYSIPFGVAGKGKGSVAAVWQALGGKQVTLRADENAASIIELDEWEMPGNVLQEWCDVIKDFFTYAKEHLGEEAFDMMREDAKRIFHGETTKIPTERDSEDGC